MVPWLGLSSPRKGNEFGLDFNFYYLLNIVNIVNIERELGAQPIRRRRRGGDGIEAIERVGMLVCISCFRRKKRTKVLCAAQPGRENQPIRTSHQGAEHRSEVLAQPRCTGSLIVIISSVC